MGRLFLFCEDVSYPKGPITVTRNECKNGRVVPSFFFSFILLLAHSVVAQFALFCPPPTILDLNLTLSHCADCIRGVPELVTSVRSLLEKKCNWHCPIGELLPTYKTITYFFPFFSPLIFLKERIIFFPSFPFIAEARWLEIFLSFLSFHRWSQVARNFSFLPFFSLLKQGDHTFSFLPFFSLLKQSGLKFSFLPLVSPLSVKIFCEKLSKRMGLSIKCSQITE